VPNVVEVTKGVPVGLDANENDEHKYIPMDNKKYFTVIVEEVDAIRDMLEQFIADLTLEVSSWETPKGILQDNTYFLKWDPNGARRYIDD
jgi:hypothetical protein